MKKKRASSYKIWKSPSSLLKAKKLLCNTGPRAQFKLLLLPTHLLHVCLSVFQLKSYYDSLPTLFKENSTGNRTHKSLYLSIFHHPLWSQSTPGAKPPTHAYVWINWLTAWLPCFIIRPFTRWGQVIWQWTLDFQHQEITQEQGTWAEGLWLLRTASASSQSSASHRKQHRRWQPRFPRQGMFLEIHGEGQDKPLCPAMDTGTACNTDPSKPAQLPLQETSDNS